jgi:hypothetical protein
MLMFHGRNVDHSGIADRACGLSSGTRHEWIAYPGTPFQLVSGSIRDTRGLGSARTPKGVANSGRAVPCLD